MKAFICLKSGDAPNDLGEFKRGDIKIVGVLRGTVYVERQILKAVNDLSKDDCRRFFFEMNINDLPDNIKIAELQELLILTKKALDHGIDIPKKINLEKIKKLLNSEDIISENVEKEERQNEPA